jgi:EAL domain-containing protein (putative c-di-GMP-specific phosphodiesterase class I)
VARLGDSPQDRTITRSIIDLGRTLGLEVVAEGVGDDGARDHLLELGCVLGQGYALAPPLDPALLPAFARGVRTRAAAGLHDVPGLPDVPDLPDLPDLPGPRYARQP